MGKTSVKKNLVYNTIYQITVMILPLITAPYISRIIGADGLGAYSYNHSIALYFVYFAMLGILNYGNRAISKCTNQEQRNKTFSSIYIFQLLTSVTVFFIYLLYSLTIKEYQNIVLIMLLHITSAIFDVSWYYFGVQEFKITSIRQLIIKIVAFISIFIFVKDKNDLWIYTLIMSASYFISSISLWLIIWKKIDFCKISKNEVIEHIKPCFILFIPIIATSVYRLMDKIMIGRFSGMTQVGYYENAEKIIMVSLGLLGSFATVIMPRISNLLAKNELEKADNLFDKSMEFSLILGSAICFGIAAVSKEFIPLFFGKEFTHSIGLSIILCITVPLITWSTIIRNLHLIPHEKDNIYVKSVILGAIINFIFNIIFIPKFDAYGATVGTIMAELALCFYQTIKIHKEIRLLKYIKQIIIFSSIGLIMFFVVRLISTLSINILLKLTIEVLFGGIVYLIFICIYLAKEKNPILMEIVNKKKNRKEI